MLVYVCVYINMHMFIKMHVLTCICVSVCVYICTYIHVCTHMHCIYVFILHTCTYTVYKYVCACIGGRGLKLLSISTSYLLYFQECLHVFSHHSACQLTPLCVHFLDSSRCPLEFICCSGMKNQICVKVGRLP